MASIMALKALRKALLIFTAGLFVSVLAVSDRLLYDLTMDPPRGLFDVSRRDPAVGGLHGLAPDLDLFVFGVFGQYSGLSVHFCGRSWRLDFVLQLEHIFYFLYHME